MSSLLLVASREARERWSLLLAAAVAGMLPVLLVALLDRAGAEHAAVFAAVLTAAFTAAVAIGLGASVLGRDIAERRLGFYFALPLPGLSIWAGKMLAAVSLTVASGLLVSLPSVFWFGTVDSLVGDLFFARGVPLLWIPVFLIAATHAGASMYRSRSGLLAWDLAAGATVLTAYALIIRQLLQAGAVSTVQIVGPWIAPGVTVALLLAGAAQITVGRADPRRGHRVLSSVLWSLLAAGALVFAVVTQWVLSVTPAATGFGSHAIVRVAPAGDYAFVTSRQVQRLGYEPAFVMNVATGSLARVDGWVVFSANGQRAAWLNGGARLFLARLEGAEATVESVPIARDDQGWAIGLSADGGRLLVGRDKGVRLLDTASGARLATAAIEGRIKASFLAPDKVRFYRHAGDRRAVPGTWVVTDWDVASGARTDRATIVGRGELRMEDVAGNRILVRDRVAARPPAVSLAVYDAETGAREVAVVEGARDAYFGRLLKDGRILFAAREGEVDRLRIADSHGAPMLSIELEGCEPQWGGQAGDIVVLRCTDRRAGNAQSALFVDTTSGRVRRDVELTVPLSGWWGSVGHDTGGAASLEGRLFTGRRGGLFLVDPATGEKRMLFAPPPGAGS